MTSVDGWSLAIYPVHVIDFQQFVRELPVLNRSQRRELSLRLLEMDCTPQEADDMAACEHSAVLGFALLDEMEAQKQAP